MLTSFTRLNRPRSIYQYSNMAPRLSGQNCKFFKLLLSLNSQERLGYKENNTKYWSFTWKPRSHVRILIYRTWPIFNIVPRLSLSNKFSIFSGPVSLSIGFIVSLSYLSREAEERESLGTRSLHFDQIWWRKISRAICTRTVWLFAVRNVLNVTPQYELNSLVTMTTYWVTDLSNIRGFSCHLCAYYTVIVDAIVKKVHQFPKI